MNDLWLTILAGWLATLCWTAFAAQAGLSVFPEAPVIACVFLAVRHEAKGVALGALLLGYAAGRQALAPLGLHEAALAVTALGTYFIAGHMLAEGKAFFAVASGSATIGYHLLLYLLKTIVVGEVRFSSWAQALFVPAGVVTALVAWPSAHVLEMLGKKVSRAPKEGLRYVR